MPAEILTLLEKNPIPRKLRTRGLSDYHPRPLASDLKDAEGMIFPVRMEPRDAWKRPYVEIQPANTWAVAVLDCDDPDWILGAMTEQVPKPSFLVHNQKNDHVQLGWILKSPVHRNKQSARTPLFKFGCVVGKLTDLFRADPAFQNTLARNPAYEGKGATTTWCHRNVKGFTLDQLDVVRDERPAELLLPRSNVGRNVAVFERLMQFAGSWDNREADLLAQARRLNSEFETPLGVLEVKYIAKSVGRYREEWLRDGRYYRQDADTKRKQQAQGLDKRRQNAEARDVKILQKSISGFSMQAVADELGLSKNTVLNVLNNEKRLRNIVSNRLGKLEQWNARKYLDKRFANPSKTTVQNPSKKYCTKTSQIY